MQIRFNVTGAERKRLVQLLAEVTDTKAKYMGPPSFDYVVGDFIVDKTGTLKLGNESADPDIVSILKRLAEHGFIREVQDTAGLCIEVPRSCFGEIVSENLTKLVKAKSQLIKHAFGKEVLEIHITQDTVRFPWFPETRDSGEIKTYTHFVTALCDMAKSLKRVNATDRHYDNEKYAFRCFLLRLGFIGQEYKEERKLLLSRLSGNTAYKNKQSGGESDDLVS